MDKSAKAPRELLIAARKEQLWSQQELARLLGTTQHNISRWEQGMTTPSPYFRKQLCALFGKTPQELGLFSQATPSVEQLLVEKQEALSSQSSGADGAQTLSLWTVPYRRNPWFTGRAALLTQLSQSLQQHTGPLALSGLGGMGKTQLALEYAHHFSQRYHFVFWIRADTQDILRLDFQGVAHLLALAGKETDPHHLIQAVKHWLDTHDDWLLLLDNVEDLQVIRDFLPTRDNGHILLTTRLQSLGTLAHRLDVEPLPREDAALLLLRRTKRLPHTALLQDASAAERTAALALADLLGGLPLALDQAGAYMETRAYRLPDYLQYYQRRSHHFLTEREQDDGTHPLSVAATFHVSFARLEHEDPVAAQVLRLCAFFLPDALPEELITADVPSSDATLAAFVRDPLVWEDTLANIRAYSLLQRNQETKILSLHRLVQVVLQEQMDEPTKRRWVEEVVSRVNQVFPESGAETTWKQCQRLLPQAQACAQLITQWQLSSLTAGQLLRRVGAYFLAHGDYPQAETFLNEARTLLLSTVGESHLELANCESELGLLFHQQGQYVRAEKYYQNALAIQEQVLPSTHPYILTCLNNLAGIAYCQGHYPQAELLFQHLLHQREEVYGTKSIEVATSLNNLAGMMYENGKYAQAEEIFQRALTIRQQELGPTHPHTLLTLGHLANTYQNLGMYQEAENYHLHVLQMREKVLGSEHASVATSLHDLARLSQDLGKPQAEELYLRALALREKLLGPDHPLTAETLHGLASLYVMQGRRGEALPLSQRALVIRNASLGTDHPKTQDTQAQYRMIREFHPHQRI